MFYNDLIGTILDISVLKDSLSIFMDKCTSLDIKINLGIIHKQTDKEIYTKLVLENIKTKNYIWVYRGVYRSNNYLLQIGANHNTEMINTHFNNKETIISLP